MRSEDKRRCWEGEERKQRGEQGEEREKRRREGEERQWILAMCSCNYPLLSWLFYLSLFILSKSNLLPGEWSFTHVNKAVTLTTGSAAKQWFSLHCSSGTNVYFIHFKLQESYWLVIDKIITLNGFRSLSALSKRSLTLIVITIYTLRLNLKHVGSCALEEQLRSIWWEHPGSASLTCPKLIPPSVKHGIGFKDREVARVRVLSAGPGAPLTCHFSPELTC